LTVVRGEQVLSNKICRAIAAAAVAVGLVACGGGGSDNNTASVRLINSTLTHQSLSMLAGGTTVVTSTPLDTVSSYAAVPVGSPTLQINDATTNNALTTLAPSVGAGAHYVLVAYESGGVVRSTIINEDTVLPATGTAQLRVFQAATDAGAIDVYVTDPATDLATLTSPSFSFGSSTSLQTSSFLSLTPGTYRIRITGAGNPADLRLDLPSFALANQEIAAAILTPTVGGTLVNASVLAQQGANSPGRNTTARVRLAAAVSGNAVVSASAAGTAVGTSVVAPSVTGYAVVPAGTPLNITINGATVASPVTALAAGGDSTLFVYGNPGSATASLIIDDNHLPTTTTSLKLRMVNGFTGAATPLTLNAAFAVIASNIVPGAASSYTVLSAATPIQLDVFTPSSPTPVYTTVGTGTGALTLPGSSVFTLFMLGDASAVPPIALLRKDR
jgi:Domain of unknown function (DUF4397)